MFKPLICVLSLGLCGCSGVDVDQYATQKPVLELDQYFNGKIDAHGMFQKRSGEVVKRFTVELDCHWVGDIGTLDEHFHYSDGSEQHRVWTLRKLGPGSYEGRAADVVGTAIGKAAGNALNWQYTLLLPVDASRYQVHFDDWMILIDAQTLLNRATMSKFGIELGSVTLSFHKAAS